MASYENHGETDKWHTPAYLFEALGVYFDMDVASPPEGPRHVPLFKKNRYIHEKSLETSWDGFIWMNPPFGHQSTKRKWLTKFFDHGCGIALFPDRTSAPWWQEYAPMADAVLFVAPKIKFEREDGTLGESPGTGTTLFAAGYHAKNALIRASTLGTVFQHIRSYA